MAIVISLALFNEMPVTKLSSSLKLRHNYRLFFIEHIQLFLSAQAVWICNQIIVQIR